MSQKNQKPVNNPSPFICVCNEVSKETIENAIKRGCRTLAKISTATTAGVGQCGGSCQPTLQKMLDTFLKTGKFEE